MLPEAEPLGRIDTRQHLDYNTALWDTETPILIQKRHPYTRNVNSETPGDN